VQERDGIRLKIQQTRVPKMKQKEVIRPIACRLSMSDRSNVLRAQCVVDRAQILPGLYSFTTSDISDWVMRSIVQIRTRNRSSRFHVGRIFSEGYCKSAARNPCQRMIVVP
jgi:hypothetical protein